MEPVLETRKPVPRTTINWLFGNTGISNLEHKFSN